ncbi:hypothetical protein ACHAQK_009994 [Fusarium lateritium]
MSSVESFQKKPGFVAVFVGATRGIGLATLKALTQTLKKPRFYVIGRSKAKFEHELTTLRECNPDAEIRFLEGKVSLLKEVDDYTKVSWLHVYPGWVATDFLSDLLHSAGAIGVVAGKMIAPVYRLIAMSEEECGQRQALHALSGRFPSRDMICAAMVDVNDQALCYGACSGFYRVLSDGRTATGGEVLGPLEKEGWPFKVFEHLEDVFDNISRKN